MKVEQIATLLNATSKEVLGETEVVKEDLSNVVDVGTTILGSGDLDNYVRNLIDRIGKVTFVNRPYSGAAPSVLMDGWEYGSVLEKIRVTKLPEAVENPTWTLTDKQSVDPNVFTKPEVVAHFYNSLTTFEIPMSFAEKQVKSAFTSASQLNAFFSMIETSIFNSKVVKLDSTIRSTINAFTAETMQKFINSPGGESMGKHALTEAGDTRCVNLLALYNAKYTKSLTAEAALTDRDFIKYATYIMSLYMGRMSSYSTLFNMGKTDKFTPKDRLHVVLLDEFKKAADMYLEADTFHRELVQLPNAETIAYWQGSGTDYDFASTSKIDVTRKETKITQSGILGVMFDREALGVSNQNNRVTNNYNPRGEFFNNWYKFDAGFFNDYDENFVVFYVA